MCIWPSEPAAITRLSITKYISLSTLDGGDRRVDSEINTLPLSTLCEDAHEDRLLASHSSSPLEVVYKLAVTGVVIFNIVVARKLYEIEIGSQNAYPFRNVVYSCCRRGQTTIHDVFIYKIFEYLLASVHCERASLTPRNKRSNTGISEFWNVPKREYFHLYYTDLLLFLTLKSTQMIQCIFPTTM